MVTHAVLHLITQFFTSHLFLGGPPPSYPTLVVGGGGGDVRLTKRRGTGGNRTQRGRGRKTILTQHCHHQNDSALTVM